VPEASPDHKDEMICEDPAKRERRLSSYMDGYDQSFNFDANPLQGFINSKQKSPNTLSDSEMDFDDRPQGLRITPSTKQTVKQSS